MTASTDVGVESGMQAEPPLGASWRAKAQAAQQAGLPAGRVLVSAPARVGEGGLGRHLQEILTALDRGGTPGVRVCKGQDAAPGGPAGGSGRWSALALERALAPLVARSPAGRMWASSVAFDREAAARLTPAEHLIAFNGTALAQFAAARSRGYGSVALVAANSHFEHLLRRHTQAQHNHPGIERPWAKHLLRRNLAEYAQAARIYVSSDYIRDSFLAEGFGEERLARFPLTPDPRYTPAPAPPTSSTFDLVYVGSLMVHKGTPLLLEAMRRLPHPDLRLRLIGGWSTRGMRRLIERACARDPRISVGPGDPLEALRGARLCVHPAYEDGFAYAPAEALACGLPVLLSEDTGMKELIDVGTNGLVLPTGDLDALTEAIDAVYRGEILGG
ncbi:MAG TPA: glycosyltransferase family 4 protein [Solirubrobacteraceae bacterium]|nr:glycosyltransferase family 4 protein [Solirubrobacteraceae bacterium]